MPVTEKRITLQTTLTCPNCGHKEEEVMPVDACRFFYECKECHQILKPEKGDCCVFCSFGSMVCPPVQLNKSCC